MPLDPYPGSPAPNTLADAAKVRAQLDAIFQSLIPIGSIVAYGGSSAPTGWLMCDGTPVSRTTYATLFTAIGTAYGTGDGSTTFNLPNFNGGSGRIPLGKGSRSLGATGGEENHTLTVNELAAHAHNPGSGSSPSFTIAVGAGPSAFLQTAGSGYGIIGNGSTNNAGTDTPHNNMQPYQVVNYIIHATT